MKKEVFPAMITNLPEVDIPFAGVKGWLLQGVDKQVVFFEVQPTAAIPEHAHGEQWGIVVEGAMELAISGVKKIYQKGDCYHIPQGAVHSVKPQTLLKVIDFFADVSRYKSKSK